MLAKEWLATFASSRPRQAYSYAIDRQVRLDALSSWGAMLIIDHLPLLLHAALLLFAFGLILYLQSSVDVAVASVLVVIAGATLLFYIIPTGLATLYEGYAKQWKRYFEIETSTSGNTKEQDLHALRWLSKHARDPRVGDSAYQALAGLRLKSADVSLASPTSDGPWAATELQAQNKLERKDKLVTTLFVDICHRLDQARIGSSQNLTGFLSTNIARYVSSLSHFVDYMLPHPYPERLTKLTVTRVAKIQSDNSQNQEQTFDLAKKGFDVLESILQDKNLPFTADAYAWITAGDLRLTRSITDVIENYKISANLPPEAVAVDTQPVPATEVNLFDLRARYSRSLMRASLQLTAHADGSAHMSAFSLIHLLDSITGTARCDALNPLTSLSTHHPQDFDNKSMLPNFYVPLIGAGLSYYINHGVVGDPDGILAGILNVLGASGTHPVVGMEITAGNALNAVAPSVEMSCTQWNRMELHRV
ncbi:hypothetical protein BDV93DRAFT_565853 [Ceratobasidium sp. AG-I]|nr:hypothetical protein BDV93DRAFT_565853 [Ceratobasidium sp. AG-I]